MTLLIDFDHARNITDAAGVCQPQCDESSRRSRCRRSRGRRSAGIRLLMTIDKLKLPIERATYATVTRSAWTTGRASSGSTCRAKSTLARLRITSHLEEHMRAARTRRRCSPRPPLAGIAGSSPAAPAGRRGRRTPADDTTPKNAETGDTVTIGFSGPAADHGWLGAINSAAIAEAEKLPRRRPQCRRGHQRRQPADQPGREIHQRRRRRHRAAADRRRRADRGRDQGDGGRHPGHQRRPRVLEHRSPPAPPSSATTTAWASAPAPTSASSSATTPTPSSPRSPASTRCR